ncbi:MAG: OsmC family peroxiredoxin [Polaromonas sp.]|uniref:OsmC family protein n=1 Tax=Polaromonas sp. TaxID=1869339 RepID=UPI00273537A0|nr:OsmC family peroxiredoxin [Polaromonas sp.]MDP2819672.1 OsmC family peroxiredoxin [Polaromonas sp.]
MSVELKRDKTHELAQAVAINRHSPITDASLKEGGDDAGPSPHDDVSGERSGIYKLAVTLQIRGALSDAQLQELEAGASKCPVHKLMVTVPTETDTQVQRLS